MGKNKRKSSKISNKNQEKKPNLKSKTIKIVVGGTSLIGLLGFLAVKFFAPLAEHFGEKSKYQIIEPGIEVNIRSVLVSKGFSEKVYDVKLVTHFRNADFDDHTIRLLDLKNKFSNKRISLADVEPFTIKAQGDTTKTVFTYSSQFDSLFDIIPYSDNSTWELTYRIAGPNLTKIKSDGKSEIDRLHFFLLPETLRKDTLNDKDFQIIGNLQEAWDKKTGEDILVGWDTLGMFLFPTQFIRVRVDKNLDGVPDLVIRVDSLKTLIEDKSDGKYVEIIPDYKLLSQKESGFVIGIFAQNNLLPKEHEEVRIKLFNPKSYKDMVAVFEDVIDEDIPLSKKQFIYWRYNTN